MTSHLKPDFWKITALIGMTEEMFAQIAVIPAAWVDPQTGLEWQCESQGRMSWYDAHTYARELSLNDKVDWRIPAVSELESLLNRSKYRPVMREVVPFQETLSYWSSTTFGPHKNNAWIVMFDGAYVLSYYKTNKYYIRCVRG